MGVSSLATKYKFENFGAANWNIRTRAITTVVVHHAATTNFDIMPGMWATTGTSAHYGIGQDGRIRAYVDENKVAWAANNANPYSISIEVTNSTGAPDWKVSDAAINSLVRLIQDINKRYGRTMTIIGHRDAPGASTVCPGPYLYSRLPDIRNRVASGSSSSSSTTSNNTTTKKGVAKAMFIFIKYKTEADRKAGKNGQYWGVNGTIRFHLGTMAEVEHYKKIVKAAGGDTYINTWVDGTTQMNVINAMTSVKNR